MVSTSVADVRGKVFQLTEERDFLGAYRYLISNGHTVESSPALWTLLARRCADLGATGLAADFYRALWEAGVVSHDAALILAAEAVKQNDLHTAKSLITDAFGDDPDDPPARLLLAQASAESAPTRALELIRKKDLLTADGALLAVDILRRNERLNEALDIAVTARKTIGNDPRLESRIARIHESLADWPMALAAWQTVAKAGGSTEFAARSNQVRLLVRLERIEQAQAIAVDLMRGDGALNDKVQLAATLGSSGLVVATLQTAFLNWRRDPDTVQDWPDTCRTLLDLGMVGVLVWLQARSLPVPRSISDVLDIALSEDERRRIGRATFSDATKHQAPHLFLDRLTKGGATAGKRPAANDKILIINATLAAGGAERQLLALCGALIEAGYEASNLHLGFFSLSVDRGHAHFLQELTALGVNIHRLDEFDADSCELSKLDQAQIALLPKQLRSDVIQATGLVQRIKPTVLHGWQDRSALACGWVGLTNNISRIILSARNMQPQKRGMLQRYAEPLFQAYCQTPNVTMTANARACAKDYEAWLRLSDGSIQTLRNGMRTENFRSVNRRRKRGRKSDGITIGGVFRLAANKRPLLWLRTLAQLREISPVRINARMIGRGPFRDDILALAKELDFTDLQMADSLSSPEEIYGPMDVLLLMSRVEGLPNVVLEAHATGLPVAACDVGGVKEALCQDSPSSGLLLPSDPSAHDAAVLLNAWLPAALNGEEKVRQDFIENRFGMAALAKATKALYQGQVQPDDA